MPAAPTPPHPAAPSPSAARRGLGSWLVFAAASGVIAALIAYTLTAMHQAIQANESDRLKVQAHVVEQAIALQLAAIKSVLAGVRQDFLAAPKGRSPALSMRLQVIADAMPGVRSMVLLDASGTVAAASVEALLDHDFSDREHFLLARANAAADPSRLHVAAPYETSLGGFTVAVVSAFVAADRRFAGAAVAALDPAYFESLMRSVLYASDMRVSLAHGSGPAFVAVAGQDVAVSASSANSSTALQVRMALPGMGKPLVVTVGRDADRVYAAWYRQAAGFAAFFILLNVGAGFGLHRAQRRERVLLQLETLAADERRHHAEQLELALQGARMGLWDWRLSDDRFSSDGFVHRLLGYAPGDIGEVGDVWRSHVHPDDAAVQLDAIEAHLRGASRAYECEFRVRHKAGHWVWLLSRGMAVAHDTSGLPTRMTGTHMDLTEKKRAEARIERQADLLRRTGRLASVGGWDIDLATGHGNWTEEVHRIYELAPQARPTFDEAIDYFAAEARPVLRLAFEAAARDGTRWDLELPFVTAKGNPRWVRMLGLAHPSEGRPDRLIGVMQDITEKKTAALELQRLNEQLARLSTTDALTEVGNRRLFDETLQSEWARATRRHEAVGLLMIDIDHFKAFNDHYGHPAGDACLRKVARLLAKAAERSGELVARYGGEEFTLLLPGADLAETCRMAERCCRIVADAGIAHGASPLSDFLSISIGAASQIASADADAAGLLGAADAALYRAKRNGRSRFES